MILRLYEYDTDKEGFDLIDEFRTGPYEELALIAVVNQSNRTMRLEMPKSEEWDTDEDEQAYYEYKEIVDCHNFEINRVNRIGVRYD